MKVEKVSVFQKERSQCLASLEKCTAEREQLIKKASLTNFERYCLECDEECIARMKSYLSIMDEAGRDVIYTVVKKGPIPYEVGDMLFGI